MTTRPRHAARRPSGTPVRADPPQPRRVAHPPARHPLRRALGLGAAALLCVPGAWFAPAFVSASDAARSLLLTSAVPADAAAADADPAPQPTASGAQPEQAPLAVTAPACTGGTLSVVAHTDDDLLFINPDQQRAINAHTCLQTVYVTAGDAGQDASYWQSRENGAKAAYASMAGVADDWQVQTISSRHLRLLTLKGNDRISLVFMRLPDGMQRGGGAKSNRGESLKKLWNGVIRSMTAVDGSNTFTKSELVASLTELMVLSRPNIVRTLDYVNTFADTDHTDHHAVGYLTKQASQKYKATHGLVSYQGYTIASKRENLSAEDARVKLAAFNVYANFDYVGQNRKYIPRQYILAKS